MVTFEKMFNVAKNPLFFILYLSFCIISFYYIDQPLAFYIHNLNLPTFWLEIITKLGWGMLYLGPLFIGAIFFRYIYKNKRWEIRCWFLWGCLITATITCNILKINFGRARPILLFQDHLYGFYGFHLEKTYWSFPSGHTCSIMSLVFALCILFPRYLKYFMVIGVLVMTSRILLTHHYLSDVIFAAYLILIEVGIIYNLVRNKTFIASLRKHGE